MRQKEEFPAVGGGGVSKMATKAVLPPTPSGYFWSRVCVSLLNVAGFQIRKWDAGTKLTCGTQRAVI
jgi:hypothetical protein